MVDKLIKHDVSVMAKQPEDSMPTFFAVLLNWFPMLLLIGVWIFFMRQMQSGGGRAMGFGKSRARLRSEEHTSELQSLMRNSYAVFCLQKKKRCQLMYKHKIYSSYYN